MVAQEPVAAINVSPVDNLIETSPSQSEEVTSSPEPEQPKSESSVEEQQQSSAPDMAQGMVAEQPAGESAC